jgi:hypothetical protein
MVGEMREEIQIALGTKKGKHRGMVIEGFKLIGLHCGMEGRLDAWCLELQCYTDFPLLARFKGDLKKRKDYLTQHNKILKHSSLTCLIVDGEVIAFPSINRNEDLLSRM